MAMIRQTLLLYTTDISRATREIISNSGAVTIRLSNAVFVASMPSTFRKESLERSSVIPPDELDDVSLTMLTAWQAVEDRDLLGPTNSWKRLVSLDRRGLAAVAVVMEMDISSSVFPLVLAGAHSLAETYAGEVERRKLTFVFEKYHVNSKPEGDSQNVPSQVGVPPAIMPVPSIHLSAWPSAVSFHNKLYCFYQGHNADASSLFYNEYDGSSWTNRREVPGVNTIEGPSAVVFNNKLYCFKQGKQGDHEVWYSSFDGNQWERSARVERTRITGGPSVLVFNNKLYCFHQGWKEPDNALWFNVFDGQEWAGDTLVEEGIITATPSAVVFNNLIYCFHQGAGIYESTLMVSVLNPVTSLWSEQKPVPNSERMSQGPSAIVVDGKMYCFHQDESAGHLYANVTSDGVEWGKDTLIADVSLCAGLATSHFNNELYYFFQKGVGGQVADGEMWYRKLKLAAEEGPISEGEPSLEDLGFEAGYNGFKQLATRVAYTTDSASYGYVVYITKSALLYDAYADDIRMCLQFREPSYIHHSFARMFAVQATYDQGLLIEDSNFPPASTVEPRYTLAWVMDWNHLFAISQLIVFHRADIDREDPYLWVLFLDKRNSKWVEMEGPKMSFRDHTSIGAPAPQFGPESKLYVFYHANVNSQATSSQEMCFNVLGVFNEKAEKIWDVEKVMRNIQGSNTPSPLSVGQYIHVFHAGRSGADELRYTSLDTRVNTWTEDRLAYDMPARSSPSAVHYMGKIYVFHIGGRQHNAQRLAVSIWDEDTLTFEKDQSINAETEHVLFGEPTAVVHTGFVYVFYVSGPGPTIWWNRFDGAVWTGPTHVTMAYSGVTPTDEGIAAYVWGDKIHCFFRGRLRAPDGLLIFYKVFNPLDSTWNEEVILPTASGFSSKPGVILNHLLAAS